jgi:N-acetylglucosaminyl-diphospho-decaprenol L-rhamnosyltransferase
MCDQQRPRVDVGVVTWNTADLTAKGLRRLLDSDQGADIRLLVRDNASTDGTPQTLARLVPEAEIDAGDENVGFSRGVNTLIRRSTAPWLLLLNSDAWPLDGAISALVHAAELHPRAAAVVPRIEYPNGRLQHSTHPFPSLRVAAITAFAWDQISRERADELLLEGAWLHDRPRRVDWAIGAAMLIRRSALDEIGDFDERFFFYAEDLEWCWRARHGGWEIWFDPSAVVHHMSSMSSDQLYGSARTREHTRNAFRFYLGAHGMASAVAWWGLNVAGAGLRYIGARIKRQDARAWFWRDHLRAQLGAPFSREKRPS